MALDNRSVSEIDELILEGIQNQFNRKLKILPKSFVRILSKVLAGVFVLLEKSTGWFYLQLFPDTASFEETTILGQRVRPLVKLGEQWGVGAPKSGSAWRGRVQFRVLSSGAVSVGTQLKSDENNLIYTVEDSVSLDSETASAIVYCAEVGTVGNLSDGAALRFVTPIAQVERECAVIETVEIGTDDETESEYRARVIQGYGAKTQGGTLYDYRTWGMDADGVQNIYPYPSDADPAYIMLYVAGNPELYPTREVPRSLCVLVGECCSFDPVTGEANRKPITDILDPAHDDTYLNVQSCTIADFTVKVTDVSGNVSAFAIQLKESLETYFLQKEPFIRGLSDETLKSGTILRTSVYGIAATVSLSAGASFSSLEIEKSGAGLTEYELGHGELARLARLVINGEEYAA